MKPQFPIFLSLGGGNLAIFRSSLYYRNQSLQPKASIEQEVFILSLPWESISIGNSSRSISSTQTAEQALKIDSPYHPHPKKLPSDLTYPNMP
jgi:hypothetical protein